MATMRALGVLVLALGVWPIGGCGDTKGDDSGESTGAPGETTSTSPASTSGDTSSPPSTSEPTTTLSSTSEVGTTEGMDMTSTGGESTSVAETGTTGGMTNAMCDPKAQDCAAGQKCTAYGLMAGDAWNANKCVPEPNEGGVAGDDCTVEPPDKFSGIDDCAKGFICLNTDDQGKNGFCVEFCSATDECPEAGGLCLPDTNDGYLPICLPQCDPLLQDCPGGQGCYGDVSLPIFVCIGPDPQTSNGQDNEPCAFTNDCLPGLHCAPAATQESCADMNCCTPFCALDEMTCTAPEVCTAFFPDLDPEYENVGICTLPP